MASRYPHGVRCIDCSKPLTDAQILRRLTALPGETGEEAVYELVCEQCLLRPNSHQEVKELP